MTTAQMIGATQKDQILQDSIDQNRHLVLTVHGTRGWRTFKSAFEGGSAAAGHVQVKTPSVEAGGAFQVPGRDEAIGVTFRLGHKKCMFGTRMASSQARTERALCLFWPDHLQQLQRRVYERVRPMKETVIPVRFWRDGEPRANSVEARNVRHGQLEDLSVGGMRVKTANPSEIEDGQTYRCVFAPKPGKPSFILDALVRHHEDAEQGRASIGFQFVGLEATPEGRRSLERLARTVSQLQRARSRNRRRV
ncbi:MAG: PilZ domain-containing protein [Phycisphaerae bacterium]|jgi:c-di-GMP-binding flagellar brake protein YcgR